MRSLKKTSYIAFMGVALLLSLVIILGFRQYQLSERYNVVITQSEEIIFQFATIKEQITTSLIKQDWSSVVTISDQLKKLNSSIARLQENTLIPGEYRLDMAKQLDIAALAITSKEILRNPDKIKGSLVLQNKMRKIAEYLLQFDRIIVSQMRSKVVHFQTVMIGALGGIICIISFSLLLLYKKALIPLLQLSDQSKNPDIHTIGFTYAKTTCTEITIFVDSVNSLLKKIQANSSGQYDPEQLTEKLGTIINESNNLSNGIINYAQLLKDSYREVAMGNEEIKILQGIIDAAEKIAALNKTI